MKILLTSLLIFTMFACSNDNTQFQSQTQRKPAYNVETLEEADATPQNAITKGSFTVWTNPSNPSAYEPYNIFIRVNLPNNISNYRQSDLTGSVTGTDGYHRTIEGGVYSTKGVSEDTSGKFTSIYQDRFEVNNNNAVLTMRIPGSYLLVRDTINVRSSVLNESQTIAIMFQ